MIINLVLYFNIKRRYEIIIHTFHLTIIAVFNPILRLLVVLKVTRFPYINDLIYYLPHELSFSFSLICPKPHRDIHYNKYYES